MSKPDLILSKTWDRVRLLPRIKVSCVWLMEKIKLDTLSRMTSHSWRKHTPSFTTLPKSSRMNRAKQVWKTSSSAKVKSLVINSNLRTRSRPTTRIRNSKKSKRSQLKTPWRLKSLRRMLSTLLRSKRRRRHKSRTLSRRWPLRRSSNLFLKNQLLVQWRNVNSRKQPKNFRRKSCQHRRATNRSKSQRKTSTCSYRLWRWWRTRTIRARRRPKIDYKLSFI